MRLAVSIAAVCAGLVVSFAGPEQPPQPTIRPRMVQVVTAGVTNLVPHYSTYRKPACEWCGCTVSLEVHHIIPQSTLKALRLPELVHDPRNLVTLCDCPAHRCHLLYGHLGNFTRDNNELAEMLAVKRKGQ